MNRYIDIYCERLEPGLWAEPLNALTNLSFFIAAFFAYRLARKEGALNVHTATLIALILIIGTGSSLFHTFATMWAQLADSIPILFYQIAFLIFYSTGVLKFSKLQTLVFLGAFFASVIGIYQLPHDLLNGSIGYAPALLFLALFAGLHFLRAEERDGGILLFAACGVFIISLTFRSIDMQLCERLSIGTHFMWHILNGCVLYLTTAAYIKSIKSNLKFTRS